MRHYTLSNAAESDLQEIDDHISADNPHAAIKMLNHLFACFELISENPRLGHTRNAWTPKPVRFWLASPYLIVYDGENKPITILRILHTRRDIANLLR